jgi:hypothetical protein
VVVGWSTSSVVEVEPQLSHWKIVSVGSVESGSPDAIDSSACWTNEKSLTPPVARISAWVNVSVASASARSFAPSSWSSVKLCETWV